jgi:hypothetical protein
LIKLAALHIERYLKGLGVSRQAVLGDVDREKLVLKISVGAHVPTTRTAFGLSILLLLATAHREPPKRQLIARRLVHPLGLSTETISYLLATFERLGDTRETPPAGSPEPFRPSLERAKPHLVGAATSTPFARMTSPGL